MRISVVIPTYQRCDQVVSCVRALEHQTFADAFEVIAVVDGSTDGTGPALRSLHTQFPLKVIEQPNQGAAAARTAGGAAASGEIVLFLDDDMTADPALLAQHDRSHREGAGVVIGHIPLHPDSPRTLLSASVAQWIDRRARRLSAPGAEVRPLDLIGGQISVSRQAFQTVGGFDTGLTCGEDVDFGYRVVRGGYRAHLNPQAISWQHYMVRARQSLRQSHESGRSSVRCARKYPEIADRFLDRPMNRPMFRLLARVPGLSSLLASVAVPLVDRGHQDRWTARLFAWAQALEYCRGLRVAGGVPRRRRLRVLAYHAIADTTGAGRFEPYGVRPEEFERQIAMLVRHGYHFVSAEEVVRYLSGSGGLPPSPVLLTFDDCFTSVLEHAAPVLKAHGIPAVAFAVTGRVGGVNDWSRSPRAPQLPLLDADGLRQLARAGVEIGAHSRSHRSLIECTDAELADEVAGACEDMKALGLGPARLFAYPYGEWDQRARDAARDAGCQAAFTVRPGVVRRGSDPFSVPRVEILRRDNGWRLRWKVALGRPLPGLDRARRGSARAPVKRWTALIGRVIRSLMPHPMRSQ